MSKEINNSVDEDLMGDAYKNLNDEQPQMLDFEEPIEVTITDDVKKHVNDVDGENNKTKISSIVFYVGIVLMIIAFAGLVKSVFTNKTVEFSQNGIKDISDWNKFKENCSSNKKDSITVKILNKDELESEEQLKFDGKTYVYGKKGKKYKYLIDEIGKSEDLGGDLRFIILSDKKYSFDEIYANMAENTKELTDNADIQEVKESVDNLNKVLDNINEVEEGADNSRIKTNDKFESNENNVNSSSVNNENKTKVEYKLIYCY